MTSPSLPANGELCRVVQHCPCGNGIAILNWHFIAEYVPSMDSAVCVHCGHDFGGPQMVIWPFGNTADGRQRVIPLTWLRRIPPLSELEETREPVYIYA